MNLSNGTYCNSYPTVFVHGILGAGDESGLHKVYRDFGAFGKDLPKEMNRRGYETFQPAVGPLNSTWDRACVLWAYLTGGTVDFGKVHSERNHHARFGRTYPGVLRDWGKEGPHRKINLLGHSLGGPTVCVFSSLLEAGCEAEKAGTPPEELSPLFQGGHGTWVHTVTTLSGTNNGTSAADFMRPAGRHAAAALLFGLGVIYSQTRAVTLFDPMNEQFGLMEDPSVRKGHHFTNPLSKRKELSNLIHSDDEVFWVMSVEFSKKQAARYTMIPGAYYFLRRACKTRENQKGHQVPKPGITPMFRVTVPILDRYRNPALGIDETWSRSDGIVPLPGMDAPVGQPVQDWNAGECLCPGRWYRMPVEDKDHQSFMGMGEKKNDFYNYYEEILDGFRRLPDA